MSAPLLRLTGITRHFPRHPDVLRDVSLTLDAGRTLGIVGESGSGKSTLGRIIVGLDRASAGTGSIDGHPLGARDLRGVVQMVFQDPMASLNGRLRVGRQVAEPIALLPASRQPAGGREEIRARVASLFERVGLRTDQMALYPHQLSGGQRQRVAIARALAPQPRLVVADEPTSALDVSVQAQILNLVAQIQREDGTAFVFIAHDIAAVAHISHEVAVLQNGRLVERGRTRSLIAYPVEEYTKRLIMAVPRIQHIAACPASEPVGLTGWID